MPASTPSTSCAHPRSPRPARRPGSSDGGPGFLGRQRGRVVGQGNHQAVRRRAGVGRRRPRRAGRRGGRAGRRQRCRKVHFGQGDLRRDHAGRRDDRVPRRAGADPPAGRCPDAGDHHGVPGPRAVREPRRGGEPAPRLRGAPVERARRGSDGAAGPRPVALLGCQDPRRAGAGRAALRRAAAIGRDRPRVARRTAAGDPRRADRGPGRRADRPGARPDRTAARPRPRRAAHLAQPRRCPRGERPRGGAAVGPQRRRVHDRVGDPGSDRRRDHRSGSMTPIVAAARDKVRRGDLGSAPVAVGLVIIGIVFSSLNDRFLTAENLTNIALQMTATGTIAIGVIMVMLLGEIDLSVGSVSGLCAVIMTVLYTQQHWNVVLAVVVAILAGAVLGAIHGLMFTKLNMPSFVATLAGLSSWLGLMLYLLGQKGPINLPFDRGVATLSNTWLPHWFAWLLVVLIALAHLAATLVTRARRASAELPVPATHWVAVRSGGLAVLLAVAVAVVNTDRGVPLILIIFGGPVVVLDLGLRRTVL